MATAGLEGREDDLRTAARLATTSGTVLFRFLAGEPQVDVDLAERSFRIPFHEPDDAGAPLLSDVVAFALICRDREAIAHLAAFDTSLLRGARSTTDDYQHEWAAALQQWARGHAPRARLAATRDAIAHAEIATPVVQRRTLGLVDALESLGRGDHQAFDRGLRVAVQAHHDYWTRGDMSFRYDGFVALQQLGVACRARDLGVAIDIDSDYLPPALLDWR